MKKIAIIGVGKLGTSIFRLLNKNPNHTVTIVDHNPVMLSVGRVHSLDNVDKLKGEYDTTIISVKPSDAIDMSRKLYLNNKFKTSKIMSAMAGVNVKTLKYMFPKNDITRLMPNLSIINGNGLTCIYHPLGHTIGASNLFIGGGRVIHMDREQDIDIATCIGSSGPAYFLKMMETMASEGREMGLSPCTSMMLAKEALRCAHSLSESNTSINDIASPNGITEKGLEILEKHKFTEIIKDVLKTSLDRTNNIFSL